MNTVCPHDKVTYEQATDIPDYGVCHFITLLSFRPGNVVVRRESHVFISQPERHLHEITYMNSRGLDRANLESESVRATHQLFASYRVNNPTSLNSGFAARSRFESPLTYRVTPRRDAPFARFKQEKRFLHTMAQITEWTPSPLLRDTLRHVMNHRSIASSLNPSERG
jgi:hypothetical protein